MIKTPSTSPNTISPLRIGDLADFDGAAKIHYLGADGRILSIRTHRKNRPVLLKHHGGIAVIAVTNSTRAASSLGSCGEQLSPVGTALGAAGADINLIFLNLIEAFGKPAERLRRSPNTSIIRTVIAFPAIFISLVIGRISGGRN